MGQNKELTVNVLPAATWNRLGVNQAVIPDVPVDNWTTIPVCKEEIRENREKTENKADWDTFADIPTGMGAAIDEIAEKTPGAGIQINGTDIESKQIQFGCLDGGQAFQDVAIYAPEGETVTVWMLVSSEKDAAGICALRTRMKAEKGATIRLVQVDLLGSKYDLLNDVGGDCAENAHIEVVQLFLGGRHVYAGCRTTLSEMAAQLDLDVGYYCRENQKLDMNYVVTHVGKRTISRMDAGGVLRDQAHKLFRGTIDFPLGASGAKGDENEDVLILGENVVNQTVPLILCAEEDVEGNHGASIGRPADDVLFYLASRGLNEAEACNLMARAKLAALCDKIGNSGLQERTVAYIEEVTGYGQ